MAFAVTILYRLLFECLIVPGLSISVSVYRCMGYVCICLFMMCPCARVLVCAHGSAQICRRPLSALHRCLAAASDAHVASSARCHAGYAHAASAQSENDDVNIENASFGFIFAKRCPHGSAKNSALNTTISENERDTSNQQ